MSLHRSGFFSSFDKVTQSSGECNSSSKKDAPPSGAQPKEFLNQRSRLRRSLIFFTQKNILVLQIFRIHHIVPVEDSFFSMHLLIFWQLDILVVTDRTCAITSENVIITILGRRSWP